MEKSPKSRKSKRIRDGWKNDEVWTLISILFNHPELWDESSAEYRDPEKRNKSLFEISRILNKDQQDVLTKWQNLRNRYMAELEKHREKNIASRPESNAEPKWEYFHALNYLNKPAPHEIIAHQDANSVYVLESMNTGEPENVKQREQQGYENLQRELILNTAINTLGHQNDDIKVFTDYVASELRKMNPENQDKIKINILRDILLTKTNNSAPSATKDSKQF